MARFVIYMLTIKESNEEISIQQMDHGFNPGAG
jgi:hypothetical protein